MNYVVACITFFNVAEKQVVVKARGWAISRAVDTVELLRRAFVKDLEIKNIDIGTEEVVRAEGQRSNVSTMEIVVAKVGSKQLLGKQNQFSSFVRCCKSVAKMFFLLLILSYKKTLYNYKKHLVLMEYSW